MNPQAVNYLFKANRNKNRTTSLDVNLTCLMLTLSRFLHTNQPQGQRHRRHSNVFIVNFEHISHYFLVFLLLTLNR